MNLIKGIYTILLLYITCNMQAQQLPVAPKIDSVSNVQVTDSLINNKFSLLDSLANNAICNSIFNPTVKLKSAIPIQVVMELNNTRDLPFLKQIKPAIVINNEWKIWYLLLLLLYLALVRLSNPRNFEQAIVSVFDLSFLSSINQWKDGKFTWTSFHLFLIYILSFSYILAQFFAYNQLLNQFNYLVLSLIIAGVILLVYIIKFIVHFIVGYLLDDTNSSLKMIINTVQIANFSSLILLLFAIFYTFINNSDFVQAIFFTIVGIFFTGILYRLIRYFINQVTKSTLPFFYIFIYLCALEISPWLIFIKILNNYLS
ncbi:MAG: DUF4271 domain-containing protein [Bacteroidota bacterium]